jgi:putative redox protein
MSLTATSRSIPGTLRQEIVIDGKHRLITDEPVEVGGEGSAPAPHELLPAALASCVSTTLVMYARRHNFDRTSVCPRSLSSTNGYRVALSRAVEFA